MANGMLNGVSSRTMSKDVFSSHYYGPTNPGTTLDLIPEGAPFSNSSINLFPLSCGFKNKCGAQTWDKLMDFRVAYTDLGNHAVFSTSGRKDAYLKSDLAKYGYVHNPDESMDRMDGWIGATLGSHAIEYAKKPAGVSGLYEGHEFIPNYSKHCPSMTNVSVPIASWSGVNMDINKVGEYVSRIANLEQDLRDVIFSDYPKVPGFNSETEAYLDFLISKELGPMREIDSIGVENIESVVARTYHNGTARLVASSDIYQKALGVAADHGLSGEEAVRFVKRMIWYHELYHVADKRKGLSKRRREIQAGELMAEFFGTRASMLGEKLAIYYRGLEKEGKEYARAYRERRIKNSIESLAKQYASEAHAMGMSEEEARDYVANKLEEEIKNLEKSDLEERVEKESKENEGGGNKAKNNKNNKDSEKRTSDEDAQEQAEEGAETTAGVSAE